MSDIKIIHGAPLPLLDRGKRTSKYPFAKMAVGDSFCCDAKITALSSAAWHAGQKSGFIFKCRRLPDGKTGCWRTA